MGLADMSGNDGSNSADSRLFPLGGGCQATGASEEEGSGARHRSSQAAVWATKGMKRLLGGRRGESRSIYGYFGRRWTVL